MPSVTSLSPETAPRRRRRRFPWGAYLALVPTLGLLGFFAYYPDINGLVHSLTNWEPGFSSPFVGLANYRAMWHDSLWWESFVHIGVIFVVAVTAMWVVPLAAAELLITLSRPRWRLFFRSALIVPLAFSPVIQVLTWQFIYDPNVGVLNDFLGKVGLTVLEKNWLGDPSTALWALIFINFPWVAGLPFLIFSAGLQNIPAEIFDAAAIDGARRWKRLLVIDLPLLLRQVKTAVLPRRSLRAAVRLRRLHRHPGRARQRDDGAGPAHRGSGFRRRRMGLRRRPLSDAPHHHDAHDRAGAAHWSPPPLERSALMAGAATAVWSAHPRHGHRPGRAPSREDG